MRCASPERPLRPGLNGSSHTVRRPFKQSSMTRTRREETFSLFSSTLGQRSSNANRLRVLGIMPQVSESPYTRIWSIDLGAQCSKGAVLEECLRVAALRARRYFACGTDA